MRHPLAALLILAVLVGALWVGDAVVWRPRIDTPRQADAVVVYGGENAQLRIQRGVALIDAGYARHLVISTDHTDKPLCRIVLPGGVRPICFRPRPFSTQGEARALRSYAARNGWHRVIVVVTTDQVARARLRTTRCFSGDVAVVAVRPDGPIVLKAPYQLAAMLKAELWQRAC